MSKIRLYGDTSGYVDVSAPAVADNRNIDLPSVLDSKLNLAGGKILQIVRATDTTERSTTSTSFVDVTGMSVTITPQKSDSGILIFTVFRSAPQASTDQIFVLYQITDASNNPVSGAENTVFGTSNLTGTATRNIAAPLSIWAYATPATTSAVTYKLRFRSEVSTINNRIANAANTGQMYAIEVSA